MPTSPCYLIKTSKSLLSPFLSILLALSTISLYTKAPSEEILTSAGLFASAKCMKLIIYNVWLDDIWIAEGLINCQYRLYNTFVIIWKFLGWCPARAIRWLAGRLLNSRVRVKVQFCLKELIRRIIWFADILKSKTWKFWPRSFILAVAAAIYFIRLYLLPLTILQ